VQRTRLGIVEHAPAELERQGRRVPELEQRPADGNREDELAGEAACRASAEIGVRDELLQFRRRLYFTQPFSL
jgi:hypothetical protein